MFAERPKRGETDEDLLKLQEEFFRNKAENKVQPSVKIVSNKKEGENNGTETNEESESIVQMAVDPHEHLSNTFEDIPKNPRLGNITEKAQTQHTPSLFVSRSLQGFPTAKRRDTSVKATGGSIFASQMKKQRIEGQPSQGTIAIGQLIIKEKVEKSVDGNVKNIPEQSYILTGDEKEKLHEENVDKLKEMSEEEILEERENLIETMDPALIAFLKSRRTKAVADKIPSMVEQIRVGEEIRLEDLQTPMDILTQPESEKWLNFDAVESSKLAWMKTVDQPVLDKDTPYEARFDFEGNILPFSQDEIDEKTRLLYHHGEEPGRPGYTLQELFQLGRSSVTQQKIVALNTIANILSLDSLGLYEGIIDLPIEQIFFVLRFCMDDNTPSVLNSAVKALRNLFVYSVDETCLDAILGFGLGFTQPTLAIDPEETEDDPTENDQQLAEKNLVMCLLRSEILVRLRYIVNVVQPSVETIVYTLDILTRLARDSYYTCMKIYKFDGLISSIIRKFVQKDYRPTANWENAPLPEAFRFLRILSSKSVGFARDLVAKFGIMETIASILSNINVSVHPNGLKLQIQALRLWTVFTTYGQASEYFETLQPILIQLFNYHVYNTELVLKTSYLMQSHVAALLGLFSEGYKKQIAHVCPESILETAFLKWGTQLASLDGYTCGKLQIISALLTCIKTLAAYDRVNKLNIDQIERCLESMLRSEGFSKITRNIKSGSNVLSKRKTKKSSANLLCVEASIWDASDHVVPIVQTNSCLPFIAALSELIQALENRKIKTIFLTHRNLSKYFGALKKCSKFSLVDNWFTQIETKLIMNVLKIAVAAQNEIDLTFFYESTVQCISLFTSEQKADMEFVLKNIVFNTNFFPSEVLLQNLSLGPEIDVLKATLNNMSEVLDVYCQVLGVRSGTFPESSSLCAPTPLKTIAPVDWIYTPIVLLYSEQQHNKNSLPEDMQINRIRTCLRWIYLYEHHFTNLASLINPTERFCRLACVFLGKDDLFLDEEINSLLNLCLKCVLKPGLDKIDFSKPIEGLSNFQDFYIQLLEQYQGVSYGNVVFGNFILIPLVHRYDQKWRKTLWSEYAGVGQIFNVTKEQLLVDYSEFISEPETDISLLKCYRRCLDNSSVRKGSVLHDIAKHHLECYIEKLKAKKT